MTESDKKALEKFDEEILYRYGKQNGRWNCMSLDEERVLKDFILKTRQEAREEVMNLPCMQYDETKYGQHDDKNDLRREIRDALNKK